MAPALGVLSLGLARDLVAEGRPAANIWVHPEVDLETQYAEAAAGQPPGQCAKNSGETLFFGLFPLVGAVNQRIQSFGL